jgi:hypothetical protein
MKSVVRVTRQGKVKEVGPRGLATVPAAEDVDSTVALIQALIPVGLKAVAEILEAEVVALAGEWYRRTGGQPGLVRWSQERGSVYLADQKLPICERRLEGYDVVALFLDGKTFADDAMVIALGVTLRGEKVVLGFVQTATEHERVCAAFLRGLLEHGLRVDQGSSVCSTGRRDSGRRSRRSSAPTQRCSAVSGTSARTW